MSDTSGGSWCFGMSLLAALFTIFVPAFLAAPGDAQRIGYFGEDYEGNLCGQLAFDGDGRMGRDLRLRPFAYWLNASSIVCVRTCPRLSDELACEYPLEALTTGAKRAALGARCFAQQRTRTAFPACLPHAPAAALPVDRWLQGHALDQLAADTLHASGVLLGCWVAAGLAGLISLGGLLFLPRLTVLIVMVGALTTALAAAAMLLPHGVRSLAAARAPLERNEATYWREEIPGTMQFALGWAACAGVGLLVLTLCARVRRAPLAAALLATPARPLLATPSLLVLPLYLFVAIGTPLCSWLTAIVYLASPCGSAEGCGLSADVLRLLWPLTLAAPYWLASAVTAWAYCASGGVVGRWYAHLAPPEGRADASSALAGAQKASGRAVPPPPPLPPPPAWPLWRSGWLSLDEHFGAIGSAAALLPFATMVRMLVPPLASAAPRTVNPYSRWCLGLVQGTLRCCLSLPRTAHPGALVYLARQPPIGLAPVTAPDARGKADRPSAHHDASPKEYQGYEEEYEEEAGLEPERPKTFLAAGQRCADLFGGRVGAGGASLSTAREAAHYIYSLLKWTIAGGVALVGWLCLTSDQAEPLMSPIWPTAIILEGSMALVSAALATHEAALEALLQCYAEEMEAAERLALSAPPPSRAGPKSARNTPLGSTPTPTAERAAAAASLFGSAQDATAGGGYGSMTSGAPYLGVGTALDPRFG